MFEFNSLEGTTHSPQEYTDYLKGNVSLTDIVEYQSGLLEYLQKVQAEHQLVTEWLKECTVLLKERLEYPPVA